MKIAILTSDFPTLSETFIINQITGLIDSGYEIEIFANFKKNNTKEHQEIVRYHLEEKVNYFNRPLGPIKRILKAMSLMIKHTPHIPFKIIQSLNFFRFGKDAWSLRLLFAVSTFQNKKFDILHCHFGPNGILGGELKQIGYDYKVITTFHGFDISTYVEKNGVGVYTDLFKQGDLFLPISNYWREKLISLGCDKEKIIVHHMGIDLDEFKFKERKISLNEPIIILTIGRLVEKKGHIYTLKAIKKLVAKGYKIKHIIAGDGPLRIELEQIALALDLKEQIEFLGSVTKEEAIGLYDKAHIFVLSSVTSIDGDQEGIPVVLMEAMAVGLPVVSTLHTGIPELVKDNYSGFLVPERDMDALAEKIEKLILNQESWLGLGKRAREIIEYEYNLEKLNRRLIKIYKKTITT